VVANATTGVEAEKVCGHIHADLIMMDIEMEDATEGIRATESILSIHPGIKIKRLHIKSGITALTWHP
jgi:DNA-binding NarL/FixJ family response regulator